MVFDFSSVVATAVAIQQVAEETRRLYLISLNAMFMAKRSGDEAGAFARVTAELRRFSERMQRQMDLLRQYVFQLVAQFSEQRRYGRILRLMVAAEALAREAGYDGPVVQQPQDGKAAAERLATNCVLFGRTLGETRRLLVVGENLAVLAKVEAAAVQRHQADGALLRVADELTLVVAGIGERLTILERGGEQARVCSA